MACFANLAACRAFLALERRKPPRSELPPVSWTGQMRRGYAAKG